MRCSELKALRWWLIFERARRYEMRRGYISTAQLAFQELALWESKIVSADLVARIERIKQRRKR